MQCRNVSSTSDCVEQFAKAAHRHKTKLSISNKQTALQESGKRDAAKKHEWRKNEKSTSLTSIESVLWFMRYAYKFPLFLSRIAVISSLFSTTFAHTSYRTVDVDLVLVFFFVSLFYFPMRSLFSSNCVFCAIDYVCSLPWCVYVSRWRNH